MRAWLHENLRRMAGVGLVLALAPAATADVAELIKSDGSDPNVFPNLKVEFGTVEFDVPFAKIFGLDIDNNLQPLPNADRYPGDLYGTLAMQKFLAASPFDQTARGILFSFLGFNNTPGSGNTQDIVKMTFTIPLRGPGGLPLGGPGLRWVKFQNGPAAGGGGGGGGPGASGGRAGGWKTPPGTPLKYWAGTIRKFKPKPGETEDEFRDRTKKGIEDKLKRKGRSRRQIMKYLKLVDDSDFMDPFENWILEVPEDNGQKELVVELAMMIEEGTFLKVAELLNNFSVAVTNDPTIAPTDPDNQPVGEILLDTATLAGGRGEGADAVSLALADVLVDAVAVIDSVPDFGLIDNAFEVTFNTGGELAAVDAATNAVDIYLANGDVHRIPFDQGGGDTGKQIARDLAFMANVWPHDGRYQFRGTARGATARISHLEGMPIEHVQLIRINESDRVEEHVVVGHCRGQECRGDTKPVDDKPIDPN